MNTTSGSTLKKGRLGAKISMKTKGNVKPKEGERTC